MIEMAFEMAEPLAAMLPAAMFVLALSSATRAPSYSMTISLCGEAEAMPVSMLTL